MRFILLASAFTLMTVPMAMAEDAAPAADAVATHAEEMVAGPVTVEQAQEVALKAMPGTVVKSMADEANANVHVFEIQQADGTVGHVKVDMTTGQVVADAH